MSEKHAPGSHALSRLAAAHHRLRRLRAHTGSHSHPSSLSHRVLGVHYAADMQGMHTACYRPAYLIVSSDARTMPLTPCYGQ